MTPEAENTQKEVSLYGWLIFLQVWIQLIHYTHTKHIFSLLVKSSLFKLETSCTVILPQIVESKGETCWACANELVCTALSLNYGSIEATVLTALVLPIKF